MASGTMDRHLTYVAMTRHRDQVQLYAGRDELKDLPTLSANMGRSGAKETTLDYAQAFAERRGLEQELEVRSEIGSSGMSERADDRPAAHFGAWGERVRAPADRQLSDTLGAGQSRQGVEREPEKVEPLIPAITSYSRSVEEVARERARPDFDCAMEAVRSIGRDVYVDPDGVAARLSAAIVDKGMHGQGLAKLLTDRPEQFGQLRGKAGLFGENKERKEARHYARAFRSHVVAVAETWERRLEEERRSEIWKREKQDVVEVPGLSRRSEVVLKQLDALTQADKPKFLEKLLGTQEGQQALAEAERIGRALERRFGSFDPRALQKEDLRIGSEDAARLDRIKDVARIADRAQRAELSRQYESKRTLSKGLGLGM